MGRESREEEVRRAREERAETGVGVETLYEEYRQRLLSSYDHELIEEPRNGAALAQQLSKQYPTLRVSIFYENGRPAVRAFPRVFVFNTSEVSLADIKAKLDPDKIKEHWPSFAEVKAYAQGYDKACVGAAELQKYKDENARLKDMEFSMMRHCPPWLR